MITRTEIALFIAALLVAVAFANTSKTSEQSDKVGGVSDTKCVTQTVTAVPVGNQASIQVLATSTSRAYAVLEQVRTAGGVGTSSVSVSLNQDALATVGNGYQLSTSTPTLTFGLNSNNAYTGAVQVITDTGSTTLRITECAYAGT